jgi:hypothetical protein
MSQKANYSAINQAMDEAYLGPSKFKQTIRWMKHMSIAFLLGAGGMGYEVYLHEHRSIKTIEDIVLGGACGQKDPKVSNQIDWYDCQDAAIAIDLNQRAMAHDQETAEILSDMSKKKPAGKSAARRGS